MPVSKPLFVKTHGKSRTRVYKVWENMKTRVSNPNTPYYKNYGGRGIGISADWEDFENFYRDMGDPPKGTTLDRVDVNLGYSKKNCRWATHSLQHTNKRPYSRFGLPSCIELKGHQYIVSFSYLRKKYYVGCFNSLQEAVKELKVKKMEIIGE